MADPRTLLAAALGVVLGVVLIAFPGAAIRVHTVGRVPGNRRGEYGTDADQPPRWLWAVRLLGVLTLLAGVYFGVTALGA